MFTPTAFEILLSKRRSVLSPAQRGTGSERAKKKETLLKRDAIKRVVHSHNFKYLHVVSTTYNICNWENANEKYKKVLFTNEIPLENNNTGN